MSTHNIQFHDKIQKKKSLKYFYPELSDEFRRYSEAIMVNEPSVF